MIPVLGAGVPPARRPLHPLPLGLPEGQLAARQGDSVSGQGGPGVGFGSLAASLPVRAAYGTWLDQAEVSLDSKPSAKMIDGGQGRAADRSTGRLVPETSAPPIGGGGSSAPQVKQTRAMELTGCQQVGQRRS